MVIKSVLLARGGSKGIPRKNIIDLNGNPLIYYTIKASLDSRVNETWVSTDDDEIEDVCINLGCKTLKRPSELSDDKASSESALLHFAEKVDFDILVFIQPTSPLLRSEDINKGLDMMEYYDSVFSAYKQHWIPYWKQNITPDGWVPGKRPRRQDVEERFVENGSFYITKRESLLISKTRCSGKTGISEMPFYRSFQIDTPEDLEFMKKIMV
jgi:CMP-N-acetylneuraminic acid synthetase